LVSSRLHSKNSRSFLANLSSMRPSLS
jgi:hypothetical protein